MLKIFDTKRGIEPDIDKIVKMLKYNNNKIVVKGSSNYINQKYFSDYDLLSFIPLSNPETIYKNITKIINTVTENPDVYFVELKLQEKNGEKIKIFKKTDIKLEDFKKTFNNLDFIKIDFVIRINNNFFELSVIYNFFKKGENKFKGDYVKKVEKDIKELIDDGNYFKALKKVFSINSYYNKQNRPVDRKIVNKISKFFNTEEYGKPYQIMGILEANKRLLENYDDPITLKKVNINLKDLGLEPNIKKINKYIKDIYKKINKEAKKIYLDITKI